MDDKQLSEAQLLYYKDLKRQHGKRAKLMELLSDGEWHPNHECAAVGGLSFNDSFFAFRQDGWLIESRRVRGGTWEFRLVGRAEEVPKHKPMTVPQRVVAAAYDEAIRESVGVEAALRVQVYVDGWLKLGCYRVVDTDI